MTAQPPGDEERKFGKRLLDFRYFAVPPGAEKNKPLFVVTLLSDIMVASVVGLRFVKQIPLPWFTVKADNLIIDIAQNKTTKMYLPVCDDLKKGTLS